MDLIILTSKKGTKVVTATNLHNALRLPAHKYNSNIKRWLSDIYAFSDDVRPPVEMRDYAPRSFIHSKQKDYYLSLELARLITLHSDSEFKLKYAKWLLSMEDTVESLTKDQIIAVLELTKVMGLISCQQSAERQHLQEYERKMGFSYEWWKYRAQLLGYTPEKLREKMDEIGKNYRGKNIRQMLLQVDKYEIIRMAVIDLFIGLGRSESYAKYIGDLAKFFARELQVEIWDDRKASIDFATTKVNQALVHEVKEFQRGGDYLRLL